jgi:hypothetical protein
MSELFPSSVSAEITQRLAQLIFSLENAIGIGDDALALQYEADIVQIYSVNPTLNN